MIEVPTKYGKNHATRWCEKNKNEYPILHGFSGMNEVIGCYVDAECWPEVHEQLDALSEWWGAEFVTYGNGGTLNVTHERTTTWDEVHKQISVTFKEAY